MKKLDVYDPALCCSTGVCGTSPDAQLAAFASTLTRFSEHVQISRYNLAQQPGAFANDSVVKAVLEKEGTDALPLLLIDGKLVVKGAYPTAEELAQLLGVELESSCCSNESASDDCCSDDEDSDCCGAEATKKDANCSGESSCC